MDNMQSFGDGLKEYLALKHYSITQVATLSGVPFRTVYNWISGRVQKPRDWTDIVKIAQALNLSNDQTDTLLQSAKHPSIGELLLETLTTEKRELLAFWNSPAPFLAPTRLTSFIGRKQEYQTLFHHHVEQRITENTVIVGMGGIGKTALALHCAYEWQSYFPDGILWIEVSRTDTMVALYTIASALGQNVSSHRTLASRSAMVRSLLASKRLLLILDDVNSDEQLESLLPPTSQLSATIITTRRHDLWLVRDAHRIALTSFVSEPSTAISLLTRHLSTTDTIQGEQSFIRLAELVDYHPLALDLLACRLAFEPATTPQLLREQLEGERPTQSLTFGQQNLYKLFDTALLRIATTLQTTFIASGVFGGDDFNAVALADVMGVSASEAHENLARLVQHSLVQERTIGRFALHDLLKAFGQERIPLYLFENMVEYFINFTEMHWRDADAIGEEIGNILYALQVAVDFNMTLLIIKGVIALYPYWNTTGAYDVAANQLRQALDVTTDQTISERIELLLYLGFSEGELGHTDYAINYLQQGLSLSQETGERRQESRILNSLAMRYEDAGEIAQARQLYVQRLEIARQLQEWVAVNTTLSNLGGMAIDAGNYDEGRHLLTEALDIARKCSDVVGQGYILNNLGSVEGHIGNVDQQEAYFQEALAIARSNQHQLNVCFRIANLAGFYLERGLLDQAALYCQEGLALAETLNHPERTVTFMRLLAESACLQEQYDVALAHLERGLAIVEPTSLQKPTARLHIQLGHVLTLTKDYVQAEQYLNSGIVTLRELDDSWYLDGGLVAMGNLCVQVEQFHRAKTFYSEVWEKGSDSSRDKQAAALFGLAQVAFHQGNASIAKRYADESLGIFVRLRHFMRNEVQQWQKLSDLLTR